MLALRRRIGFGASESLERVVVVQADRFATALDTVLVAPLDRAVAAYDRFPGVARISGAEAGAPSDHVVVVTALHAVPVDRFRQEPVGRLRPPSLAQLSRLLRMLLEI